MEKIEHIQSLYIQYAEHEPIDDPVFWEHYKQLQKSVACLPTQMREEILCAAERLAAYQEQKAFQAGALSLAPTEKR